MVKTRNTTCTGNLFKVWHPDQFILKIFLLWPFLDTCRTLALEHVMFQKGVLSLRQGGTEELDPVVGRGDLFAGPDVPAADHHARLVHVEPEGVGVAAVVDQGHAGVDGRPNNFPIVRRFLGRQLCQLKFKKIYKVKKGRYFNLLTVEALHSNEMVKQSKDELLSRMQASVSLE